MRAAGRWTCLTQRHRDTEFLRMIWRWGSTPYPECLRITSDCPAFGGWGNAPATNHLCFVAKDIPRVLHVLHVLACNFIVTSFICFRCLEFWSLGGLENSYNLLQNSETPNLPVAEAIVKVILMCIPLQIYDIGLADKYHWKQQRQEVVFTSCHRCFQAF